jgi:hypothetical protein
MGARGAGGRDAGEDIAAEPVPVRRPGVLEVGVPAREERIVTGVVTGRTKIGLNLEKMS